VSFTGFDPAAIALLDRLPGMTSDEYAAHKGELSAGVTRPGAALIATVADRLDADLTATPRSSVSPLHRDLRFAPEGAARYKDHLLLTTWEGADKKASPMFWLRVDATRVGYASGIGFTPVIRERWRAAVGVERRTGFQVRFVEPLPDSVGTPGFAEWCTDRLAALLPVHRWLTTNLIV